MNENTTAVAKTGSTGQAPSVPQSAIAPAVDIVENDVGITLLADMPGVSRERLAVKVDGDNLTIEGSAEVSVPEKLELLHSEIRNPHFRRSFTLSRELDPSRIEASLKDGVLRMHIPKSEEARPRRIEVNVA
jgi:HSP20 family molecular chaperone IbpA